MCSSRKQSWAKRASAHRAAKRLTRFNRAAKAGEEHAGLEVAAYQCGICGLWHITTQRERVA